MKRSFFNLYVQFRHVMRKSNNDKIRNIRVVEDIPEFEIMTEFPKVDIPKNFRMSVNKDSLISIKNFTENRCI